MTCDTAKHAETGVNLVSTQYIHFIESGMISSETLDNPVYRSSREKPSSCMKAAERKEAPAMLTCRFTKEGAAPTEFDLRQMTKRLFKANSQRSMTHQKAP
jgi:hypothetical protein